MYTVQRPSTGIQHKEDLCRANIDQTEMGEGSLYITESEVLWTKNDGMGFRLQYRDIAVHAISTDLQNFAEECLYVMYNRMLLTSDDSSDDENPVSEVRFIPNDKGNLKSMFNAMSDCQCLHPDEEDSDYDPGEGEYEDGAGGEGFYTGEEGLDHLTPQGQATMQRLEAMLLQNEDGASGDNLESDVNGLHLNNGEEGQFDDA